MQLFDDSCIFVINFTIVIVGVLQLYMRHIIYHKLQCSNNPCVTKHLRNISERSDGPFKDHIQYRFDN